MAKCEDCEKYKAVIREYAVVLKAIKSMIKDVYDRPASILR
jgi:hypothetical protein